MWAFSCPFIGSSAASFPAMPWRTGVHRTVSFHPPVVEMVGGIVEGANYVLSARVSVSVAGDDGGLVVDPD